MVFCQPLGERDNQTEKESETEMAVAGLLPVLSSPGSSPNPLFNHTGQRKFINCA